MQDSWQENVIMKEFVMSVLSLVVRGEIVKYNF